jgi:hypothetical protein
LGLDAVPLVSVGFRCMWVVVVSVLRKARGIDVSRVSSVLIVEVPRVEMRDGAATVCRLHVVDGTLKGHFLGSC